MIVWGFVEITVSRHMEVENNATIANGRERGFTDAIYIRLSHLDFETKHGNENEIQI